MKKKLLSMLMVATMVLTLMPTTALAGKKNKDKATEVDPIVVEEAVEAEEEVVLEVEEEAQEPEVAEEPEEDNGIALASEEDYDIMPLSEDANGDDVPDSDQPYTLTFDKGELDDDPDYGDIKSWPDDVTYLSLGDTVELPDDPTNEYVEFAGWEIDGKIYEAGDTYTITGNATATAKAVEYTYQVTYDDNLEDKVVEMPTSAPCTTTNSTYITTVLGHDVEREGYILLGWATTPTGEVAYVVGDSIPLYSTDPVITLYAVWQAIPYATVNNGTGDGYYEAGDTVSITADKAPAEMEFDYWSGNVTFADADDASTTFTMPDSNVTVTANYKSTIQYYDVTYSDGGDTAYGAVVIDLPANEDSVEEGSYTISGSPSKSNSLNWAFTFFGWSVEDAKGNVTTVKNGESYTLSSDITVTPVFTLFTLNGDERWGSADLTYMEQIYLNELTEDEIGPEVFALADYDGNGRIGSADLTNYELMYYNDNWNFS